MEKQIAVEHAKFVFISAFDGAGDAAAMAVALAQVDHPQRRSSGADHRVVRRHRAGGRGRVRRSRPTPYTTVLAEIASQLDDPAYMAELSAKMLARAAPGGRPVLRRQQDRHRAPDGGCGIEVHLVAAFNAAATGQRLWRRSRPTRPLC